MKTPTPTLPDDLEKQIDEILFKYGRWEYEKDRGIKGDTPALKLTFFEAKTALSSLIREQRADAIKSYKKVLAEERRLKGKK